MNLKPFEISKVIQSQIENYEVDLEVSEIGSVITVGDGIALIYGLENAMAGELLLFEDDVYGMVLNLEASNVGAVILGNDVHIREGDKVRRTGRIKLKQYNHIKSIVRTIKCPLFINHTPNS